MVKRGMLILLFIFILAFSVIADMTSELVSPSDGLVILDVDIGDVKCKVTNKNATEEFTELNVWYKNNESVAWQAGSSPRSDPVDNTEYTFSLTSLVNATYTWNCKAVNNESNEVFASANLTFIVSFTTAAPPPTNQGPTLLSNIPDMAWPEDTVNNSLNLSAYFSDPDNDPLTFSVSTSPSNIDASISTGIVTFTPNANWTGSTSVKFSASDGAASTESNSVSITITPVNDPPLLVKEIPNLTWAENTNKKIDLDDYFSDIDGDSLNFTFTSVASINVTIDEDDHDATFTPDTDWTGSSTMTFTALDASNLSVTSNSFILQVTEEEEPEDVMILTKSPADENVEMTVGESKTFSITKQPSNATVKWYADNLLQTNETADSFVYKPTTEGSHTIRVQILAGGTSDDHQWTVTVSASGAATTPTPKAAEPQETEAEEKGIACGNGECEEGEDQFSCCVDCDCPEGYTCNEQTKTCRREKEAENINLIIIVAVLFVSGAVGGYFYYKKKQEKEIFGLANEPIEIPPLKKEAKPEAKKETKPAEKKPVTAEKPVKKAKTTNQILLKNYILTNLRKGKSFEEIKKTLLKVGWTEEQIQEAYTAAELDKAFS